MNVLDNAMVLPIKILNWHSSRGAITFGEVNNMKMVNKQSWQEFREAGLLWWINMILHTFGWALAIEIDDETKEIVNAYPARVKFRGFDEKHNTEGYIKVSNHLKENVESLLKESME